MVKDNQARDDLDLGFVQIRTPADLAHQLVDRLRLEVEPGIGEIGRFLQQVLHRAQDLLHGLDRIVEPLHRAGERSDLQIQTLGPAGHWISSPETP